VPVSCAVQKPNSSPRRSFDWCLRNTRASSILIALPAALSVAASPGHESWWPPTMMKSFDSGPFCAASSAMVICTGRQPFVTCVRNQTRTGAVAPPCSHISFRRRPATRATPMHGIAAISSL
jgi:hypothetical protein